MDWDHWDRTRRARPRAPTDEATVARLTREWYAGAELELIQSHGLQAEDAAHYSGLGTAAIAVQTASRGRYRNVADEYGLIGQRLGWAAKGIWTALSATHAPLDSSFRQGALTLCWRFSLRARAPRREHDRRTRHDGLDAENALLRRGLVMLGNMGLQIRGAAPLLVRLVHCNCVQPMTAARGIYDEINTSMKSLGAQRRKRTLRQTRDWARSAPDRVGHRVTKQKEVSFLRSASSDKSHRGEHTDQAAADGGIAEWGAIWHSSDVDHGDLIVDQISRIYNTKKADDHEEVMLPEISDDSVLRAALRFRSDTAVGVDGARPRHFGRLSKPARAALGHLFMIFETNRRWTDIIREVIEVARGKKAGGARLVGLGASLYRLWARIRFDDIRDIIEQRIERRYFAAAPGKGVRPRRPGHDPHDRGSQIEGPLICYYQRRS